MINEPLNIFIHDLECSLFLEDVNRPFGKSDNPTFRSKVFKLATSSEVQRPSRQRLKFPCGSIELDNKVEIWYNSCNDYN